MKTYPSKGDSAYFLKHKKQLSYYTFEEACYLLGYDAAVRYAACEWNAGRFGKTADGDIEPFTLANDFLRLFHDSYRIEITADNDFYIIFVEATKEGLIKLALKCHDPKKPSFWRHFDDIEAVGKYRDFEAELRSQYTHFKAENYQSIFKFDSKRTYRPSYENASSSTNTIAEAA